MTADDVTRRAARIINEANWKADFKGGARADEIARALDAAGLLATPEHDAAVAAKALREAATLDFTVPAQKWLHDRADHLERGAGESS